MVPPTHDLMKIVQFFYNDTSSGQRNLYHCCNLSSLFSFRSLSRLCSINFFSSNRIVAPFTNLELSSAEFSPRLLFLPAEWKLPRQHAADSSEKDDPRQKTHKEGSQTILAGKPREKVASRWFFVVQLSAFQAREREECVWYRYRLQQLLR